MGPFDSAIAIVPEGVPMLYILPVRVGVLLLSLLSLVMLSGCPGSSASGGRGGAMNEEPDRHGSDQDRSRGGMGGGMMGGGM